MTAAGMSLNQVAGQVAMPLAMAMTGIIIDAAGFSGAYLFSAIGHFLAIVFIALMAYQPIVATSHTTTWHDGFREIFKDIGIGINYARNHPIILWVIILLVMMMSLGYPATASLGPTWVTTVVEVPIPRMGFVVMFWGLGSLTAAILLTRFSSTERRGALVAFGALLFSISFVIFVSGRQEINVIIGNFGLGAGMTITMVSSTILIQHLVPNEIRGRIMSIFQLNMAFAQLMTMPVAMLGQWLTLPVLFPVMSFLTLALVIVILITQPQLIRAVTSQH
jgi:ENTS family enterobactin (siderophore) exporter